MTIAAQSVIKQAAFLLNDIASISWTVDRLVDYLNGGLKETSSLRPDLFIRGEDVTLVAGFRQAIPSSGEKFVSVNHNVSASLRDVTKVDGSDIDACDPGWRGRTGQREVLHFMYDPRTPREFEVYPVVQAGTQVNIDFVAGVSPIAIPAAGLTYTSVAGDIDLPEALFSTLVDYVLYRAHSEHNQYAQPARALAHRQAYEGSLGIESRGTATVAADQS